MKENSLITEIKEMAILTSGIQKEYYDDMVKNARAVKVVSLYSIFPKSRVEKIRHIINPQAKECYKNAYNFATLLNLDNVKYCEGKFSVCGLGIDHAFNKIGDKYVDITAEFVLGKDVTKENYILIGEYGQNDIRRIALKTKEYGGVFNELFIENLKR